MQSINPHISVVSPVYRAEKMLDKLVEEIEVAVQKLNVSYEIILIDDRSPDQSWLKMKEISAKNPNVKSIRLSKNFGQYPTTTAGLAHAKGDWIVVIDCDLQDQPFEIVNLYNKAQEGFDSVIAVRAERKDSFLRKFASSTFSKLFNYLTGTERNTKASNFGIYKNKVIQALLSTGDMVKFFPLFIKWVGFNQVYLEVEHGGRDEGNSSYNWSKLIDLALKTILSFSNKPLYLFVRFGLFTSIVSFVVGIYNIIQYILGNIPVLGYSSLIVAICFFSGMIIAIIGVVGMYIGQILDQTKGRPEYIIDEILNDK